jgi:plasmid stabilization system protein ParE
VARIFEAIWTLESFPERCPLAPESMSLETEIRQRIIGDDRALFTVDRRTVFVLHVRHGHREPATKEDLASALGELRPRLLR